MAIRIVTAPFFSLRSWLQLLLIGRDTVTFLKPRFLAYRKHSQMKTTVHAEVGFRMQQEFKSNLIQVLWRFKAAYVKLR